MPRLLILTIMGRAWIGGITIIWSVTSAATIRRVHVWYTD
jgi:hypothetical protein